MDPQPLPRSVAERLRRLAPDQRAAAVAAPGPVLCVAPAGSGKTTTLVARIAWLVATGVPPTEITAVTFNRRAADELRERLGAALDWGDRPTGREGERGGVRVRTFHALGLEVLRDASGGPPRIASRESVLRALDLPGIGSRAAVLDAAFSRLKLDLGVNAAEVAADEMAGPIARAFVAYEARLAELGAIDFDDLVRLALRALERDADLLRRWRIRCRNLLVDETQDVDASQLRLALLLAAPENRIFLVGDDDQSIYGWRLADVRRVLGLAAALPGLRRIDLEVNYRCPAPVLQRAVRLVEHNRERFGKRIRPGPHSAGRLVLAPDGGDDVARIERLLRSWTGLGGTFAILARTNRELLPAAAVALELGLPFRAPTLELLVEDPRLDSLLDALRATPDPELPLLVQVGRLRSLAPGTLSGRTQAASAPMHSAAVPLRSVPAPDPDDPASAASGLAIPDGDPGHPTDADDPPAPTALDELVAALLGWAAGHADVASLEAAILRARSKLGRLRRDDAALTLATAHATKGLEFDHVGVIGMDEGRFPSARAIADAADPDRAIEEERRLAYVAWTRARRSLTLVFDPDAPSRFILEAFDPDELGARTG